MYFSVRECMRVVEETGGKMIILFVSKVHLPKEVRVDKIVNIDETIARETSMLGLYLSPVLLRLT